MDPSGRRSDGRGPHDLRKIRIRAGVLNRAEGSAYVEWGNNKVMAAVYGPRDMGNDMSPDPDRAVINCRYNMAPFSVSDRKRPGQDRRSREIGRIMSEALSSVVMLEKFPKTKIDVYTEILEADGGTRCAAITAASVALADAGIPMRDLIPACAVGVAAGRVIVDLNKDEDSLGEADLPMAIIPHKGEIVLLQMEGAMTQDQFGEALDLGIKACEKVHAFQREALIDRYESDPEKDRKADLFENWSVDRFHYIDDGGSESGGGGK
ncbi:MAG: exosome complex exonuclease Rrp41 [Thermoplasmatota archaeon]